MLWGPAKSWNLALTLKLQFQPRNPANLLELEMTQSWILTLYPTILSIFFRLQTSKQKKHVLKNLWSSSSISSSFNGFQTIWKATHLVTKFPPGWHSPQLLSAISLNKIENWIVHNPDTVTKQAIWTKQLHGDHHILEAFKGTFSVYGLMWLETPVIQSLKLDLFRKIRKSMICLLMFHALGFSPLKNAKLALDPAKMQSLESTSLQVRKGKTFINVFHRHRG